MTQKTKTRIVNINITPNAFSTIFKRFVGEKSDYEFSGLSDLRQILSNEKAKILYAIKYYKPQSLYHLAKMLDKDFKSLTEDVKTLERFGFIELKREHQGKRIKLRPVLAVNSMQINFQF